jgi:hypothetical protein
MEKGDLVSVRSLLRLAGGVVISPEAEGAVVSVHPAGVAVDFETGRGVYQRVYFYHGDEGPRSRACVEELCVKNKEDE